MFIHGFAALVLFGEFTRSLQRYREGDGNQHMQLQPTLGGDGGTNGRGSAGSPIGGMSNPASDSHHYV